MCELYHDGKSLDNQEITKTKLNFGLCVGLSTLYLATEKVLVKDILPIVGFPRSFLSISICDETHCIYSFVLIPAKWNLLFFFISKLNTQHTSG